MMPGLSNRSRKTKSYLSIEKTNLWYFAQQLIRHLKDF